MMFCLLKLLLQQIKEFKMPEAFLLSLTHAVFAIPEVASLARQLYRIMSCNSVAQTFEAFSSSV